MLAETLLTQVRAYVRQHLAVFGATGKIGHLVVAQLLAAGDQVTAYVRNPAKLTLTDPNLTVVTGALTDPDPIHAAITGSQAVTPCPS